jgi:membrane protein required for colicin V production
MPLTIFDFILIGIMLISGLVALMRGFTREVLSLVAWGAAAIAAYFAVKEPKLVELAMARVPYLDKEILAQIAVGAVAFLIVLILVSIISVRISDLVIDSSAGAFDRTLGFFFGVLRGFVFVTICYMFYGWLYTPEKQEPWVQGAASMPALVATGKFICGLMPPDICDTLMKTALQQAPAPPPAGRQPEQPEGGYQKNDNQGLENLIEGTGGSQQPAFGQSNGQ